jgi:predicted Rossmann fold flavoprotein
LKHELLIIGGGAAGLMAAVAAKDSGIDTAIIEATNRVGKKILTTGNGRCNISNVTIDDTIKLYAAHEENKAPSPLIPPRYHGENLGFHIPVLQSFTVGQTIDFFKLLGLPIITLEEGKMYPMSLQASSVLDIFRFALEERSVPVYLEHKVVKIKPLKDGFKVICKTSEGESTFQCRKIIFCTGGKSAPNTDSDGSGYTILKELGHRVITPIPALVQLKLNYKNLKALSGIKFEGSAEISVNGKPLRRELGEILYTDYGISGPPIIQLSRTASFNLNKKNIVTLKIDMLPDLSTDDLENTLETHWALFGHRSVHDSFIGLINKKIIPIILKEAGLDNIHKPCWELEWNEKRSIYNLLKAWEFTVIDTNSFSNAQVTAGGIDTKEVNAITLESKLIPNLYLAGEVLDVDGDCGGYNLQWAWSSGYIAAVSASKIS